MMSLCWSVLLIAADLGTGFWGRPAGNGLKGAVAEKQSGHPKGARSQKSANSAAKLRSRPNRRRLARRYWLLLAIRLLRLSALANVDAALEESAIFNRDARRNHIPGQRTIAADVHAITRGQTPAHFSKHHN